MGPIPITTAKPDPLPESPPLKTPEAEGFSMEILGNTDIQSIGIHKIPISQKLSSAGDVSSQKQVLQFC